MRHFILMGLKIQETTNSTKIVANFSPILNFILNVLGGAIRDQASNMICNAVKNSAIPAVNRAFSNLPGFRTIINSNTMINI